MRNLVALFTVLMLLSGMLAPVAAAPFAVSRVKDVAKVQGVRSNQLVGYGLVVGLAGTGDSNKIQETIQSIANMLKTFGIVLTAGDISDLKMKNVAAAVVTAQLPPFAKPGDTIDITVSSIGDAKSLQGGTLIQTPLRAANGQVYAVAQGAVSTGGFAAGGRSGSQQKNFPTVGTTPNGAIVEQDVPMEFSNEGTIRLSLNQPDFTTASRISNAIDDRFGGISIARDPGTVEISIPGAYRNNVVGFVAAVEELAVAPDNIARVIVNERTGTVVMGGNVAIDEVAVAQGGLNIKITKTTDVSQPPPFSYGNTETTTNTELDVEEEAGSLIVLPATANVSDVVNSLNAVGATPRDIISILQAIKAAGALHADLQII
ncbi:flagellar basal body P-ring protein FlgI|uniref:Flagellar P-ring protein n=1 Tax=Dendrosporobacter quercicolus TaxID=146817 RepID=A0A1G9R3A8_9FIRM|nr:flagellar basal body P-ring protein FlgI [Dendrosporobacter quercicolus]NSL48463.1 flagellar basal body P-ring protein FlgI [Dendrosporobacter quercicolus DSM 1736]SDM17713.1 flagellar P-ring protein precursor FlgI [Dendrosporobacter quercicolus]